MTGAVFPFTNLHSNFLQVVDIHAVLPVLAALLQSADAEVLSHACWALSHLCDGPSAHISAVVGADVCWRLVQLLTHRSWRVTQPALRTIGNIVCAEDETDYTQHILEAGAVPCLRQVWVGGGGAFVDWLVSPQ